MKKILFITHWFHPHQVPRAFRSFELYQEMISRGFIVDVIISKEKKMILGNTLSQEDVEANKSIGKDNHKFIKRIKSNIIYSFFRKILMFFLGEFQFVTRRKYLEKTLNDIDLHEYDSVLVISLPLYPAYFAAKIFSKKNIQEKWTGNFILDMGDPFYGNQLKRASYFRNIQKKIFSFFDFITIPIEEAKTYYEDYTDKQKVKIIPQAFNLERISLLSYEKNHIPTFAYAGTFYEDIRNPSNLFKYLIKSNRKFKFVIYTNMSTPTFNKIYNDNKKNLDDGFEFKSAIPRDELIPLLSRMDFLINLENLSGTQSPSKLIDYGLTMRPILSLNPSDTEYFDLELFMDGKYENKIDINMNDYDINTVTDKFLELMYRDKGLINEQES